MRPPFNLNLSDSWDLADRDFQLTALAISLQGIVNSGGELLLYLTYPQDWAYSYTRRCEYVSTTYNMTFTDLSEEGGAGVFKALKLLRKHISGYIVWDPTVRSSLSVAFTAAGVEKSIVVPPYLAAHCESLGLVKKGDFNEIFRGMSRVEIFSFAKEKYWNQTRAQGSGYGWVCLSYGTWPGIADFGVSRSAFFVSSQPTKRVMTSSSQRSLWQTLLRLQVPPERDG